MSRYVDFHITVVFMMIIVKEMVHLITKETLTLWPVTHLEFYACFTVPSAWGTFSDVLSRAFS